MMKILQKVKVQAQFSNHDDNAAMLARVPSKNRAKPGLVAQESELAQNSLKYPAV
jgi:hypothetical protein